MAHTTVSNWFGDLSFHPARVAEIDSQTDIASVLKKTDVFPSPVRPAGSRHSTTRCAAVEGGTLLDMRRLDRVIEIGEDFVTAEAGALYLDVSQALAQRDLQSASVSTPSRPGARPSIPRAACSTSTSRNCWHDFPRSMKCMTW